MRPFVVVLSGFIASGKSTLARMLEEFGLHVLRTRDVLVAEARKTSGHDPDRFELQMIGETLDEQTSGGQWVSAYVLEGLGKSPPGVVVDSVRRLEQVQALRDSLPPTCRVYHIHLDCQDQNRLERYNRRGEGTDFWAAAANTTEALVYKLRSSADLVIDTTNCAPDDVRIRVLSRLGLRRFNQDRLVDVLVGGQYGSEGKGHIVAHLAPEYDVLLRVGGPNAGHTVLHPLDDHKVSFYHLPSGALHNMNATLVLGPGAVINPTILEKEAEHLGGLAKLAGRLFIDPQARIILPQDIASEVEVVKAIGSTGQGVGAATAGKILGRQQDWPSLARDLDFLSPFIRSTRDVLDAAYRNGHRVMLEGTQGTGLSLHHGHYPYVTSRDTAASGTLGEAGIPPGRVRKVVAVLRTFPIRVQSPTGGTSGPMGLETTWEEVSRTAGEDPDILREREKTTTTKRQRRVAHFSWADLHRCVALNLPTDLALTFVDYLGRDNQQARRYEQLLPTTQRFIEEIEQVAGCPVSLINTRCHRRSVIDRRAW